MTDPFRIVRDFESALCEYTGAPFAVTTNSCTAALMLAVAWNLKSKVPHFQALTGMRLPFNIEIPKRTYVSVPQSIIHAGGWPAFRDEDWTGAYQLKPLPVWDCARRFTSNMWNTLDTPDGPRTDGAHPMLCVSFHHSKILGDSQGGAILHDDQEADRWLRRARFDGRTEGVAPKDDTFDMLGWHCYINPTTSARLLKMMQFLPRHNEPLPNDPYPDLSTMSVFQ